MPASPPPADAPPAGNERLIAILLMCGALLGFTLIDTTGKWLGQYLPISQVVWTRYASAVAVGLIFMNPVNTPGMLKSNRLGLQIVRSLLLVVSTALNFVALRYLQLDQTMAIMFATPFITAILAGPLLGEWVGLRRWIAIGVGFFGVLVITRPGLGGLHPAMLLTFAGAICYALYNITTRILAKHDSSATTLFYSAAIGAAVSTPLAAAEWTMPPNWQVWMMMGVIGIFAMLGHYLLILAHRLAPASVLAPFIYTQMVWMILSGFVIFGQVPQFWTMAGAAIVIASGLYLLYRERVRSQGPA